MANWPARELNVEVIVEGNIQKLGPQMRVHVQVWNAADGSTLLSTKHDAEVTELFALQDRITEQIVVAIEPEIQTRERERVRNKPPGNLGAWGLLQRGLSLSRQVSEALRIDLANKVSGVQAFRESFQACT